MTTKVRALKSRYGAMASLCRAFRVVRKKPARGPAAAQGGRPTKQLANAQSLSSRALSLNRHKASRWRGNVSHANHHREVTVRKICRQPEVELVQAGEARRRSGVQDVVIPERDTRNQHRDTC